MRSMGQLAGGIMNDVPDIANFVRDFELFGLGGGMGGAFLLKPLALCFRQGFVVGHLANDVGNSPSEMLFDFRKGGFGVFHRIVEDCRQQKVFIGYVAFFRKDTGGRNEVVDIGVGRDILAPLVFVFLRCKGNRLE